MNHILKLQQDNADLREKLAAVDQQTRDFQSYLLSPKFAGTSKDYVVVSNDALPKLAAIRATIAG